MESRDHFVKEMGMTPEEFCALMEKADEIASADERTMEKVVELSIDDIDIEYVREGIEREKEEFAWA